MWRRIRVWLNPAMGDAYAKGWEQGRKDAIADIKVAIIRARPTISVTMEREYMQVEDVLDLVDRARDPNFHPERNLS